MRDETPGTSEASTGRETDLVDGAPQTNVSVCQVPFPSKVQSGRILHKGRVDETWVHCCPFRRVTSAFYWTPTN